MMYQIVFSREAEEDFVRMFDFAFEGDSTVQPAT